jgi:hypothetical protein
MEADKTNVGIQAKLAAQSILSLSPPQTLGAATLKWTLRSHTYSVLCSKYAQKDKEMRLPMEPVPPQNTFRVNGKNRNK